MEDPRPDVAALLRSGRTIDLLSLYDFDSVGALRGRAGLRAAGCPGNRRCAGQFLQAHDCGRCPRRPSRGAAMAARARQPRHWLRRVVHYLFFKVPLGAATTSCAAAYIGSVLLQPAFWLVTGALGLLSLYRCRASGRLSSASAGHDQPGRCADLLLSNLALVKACTSWGTAHRRAVRFAGYRWVWPSSS
jgi:hypothetical protein